MSTFAGRLFLRAFLRRQEASPSPPLEKKKEEERQGQNVVADQEEAKGPAIALGWLAALPAGEEKESKVSEEKNLGGGPPRLVGGEDAFSCIVM